MSPSAVVFTSGGTEADALAILGVVGANKGGRPHVVTSSLEHPAVTKTLELLAANHSIELTQVHADRTGRCECEAIGAALRDHTVLVSLVWACNETGVLQPIEEVGALCQARGVLLMVDGVQAVGRVPLSMASGAVDLLSLSGHKVGAVGGVGALIVRPGVEIAPVLTGGGQEGGLRSGTENVAGAASLAAALAAAAPDDARALGEHRDRLERSFCEALADVEVLGRFMPRLSNTCCVRFGGCEGDAIMMALDQRGIALSTGSACSSGSVTPSPILVGMGLSRAEAKETVRFSLGAGVTAADIDAAAEATVQVVKEVRRLSTLGSP